MTTEAEIARAHAKIRAGAQFLVSRPVYELDALTRLVEALDGTGVPLLLSVAPLRSFEEADYLAHEVPGVTIPAATLDAMEKAGRWAAAPSAPSWPRTCSPRPARWSAASCSPRPTTTWPPWCR